ncbi:C-C motif chemokine 20-like isoform X2 [Brienomyrus brachyistius]|uniref:C-C motif chemokine 20-like isoform X2 n=1 Tax=Brienomyrus brachyistius TaxID=42636 RepID=UPI0020B26FF1|nr:C-C motif chemokine 20-like isoform X2 [Brienomyrus brachyistius]
MSSSWSYSAALLMLVTLHLLLSRTESASCCVGYSSKRLPCYKLKRYTIQPITGTCDIVAVIFHTKKGGFICANPLQHWTLNRMKCLHERAQARKMRISSRG